MLSAGLRTAGHQCDHVSTLLGADAQDINIALAANQLRAVLISKDSDFVDLASRNTLQVPLVRIRLGNMTKQATCAIVLARLPQIVAALEAGGRIVEVR